MRPSDQQVTTKRKWSADKTAGPLVLLAELIQKRLNQHGWPCDYVRTTAHFLGPEENAGVETTLLAVHFVPARGRPKCNEEFWDAFDAVLRVVAHEKRLRAYRVDANLHLDGQYHVNKYGVIKAGNPPAPF